jgi:hypothetical protein
MKEFRPYLHLEAESNDEKALTLKVIMTDFDQNLIRYGTNFENVGFGQKVTRHPIGRGNLSKTAEDSCKNANFYKSQLALIVSIV